MMIWFGKSISKCLYLLFWMTLKKACRKSFFTRMSSNRMYLFNLLWKEPRKETLDVCLGEIDDSFLLFCFLLPSWVILLLLVCFLLPSLVILFLLFCFHFHFFLNIDNAFTAPKISLHFNRQGRRNNHFSWK